MNRIIKDIYWSSEKIIFFSSSPEMRSIYKQSLVLTWYCIKRLHWGRLWHRGWEWGWCEIFQSFHFWRRCPASKLCWRQSWSSTWFSLKIRISLQRGLWDKYVMILIVKYQQKKYQISCHPYPPPLQEQEASLDSVIFYHSIVVAELFENCIPENQKDSISSWESTLNQSIEDVKLQSVQLREEMMKSFLPFSHHQCLRNFVQKHLHRQVMDHLK